MKIFVPGLDRRDSAHTVGRLSDSTGAELTSPVRRSGMPRTDCFSTKWDSDVKERTKLVEDMEKRLTAIAKVLVESGAKLDINDKATRTYMLPVAWTKNTWTPLHYAAYNNRADIIRILADAGALLNPRDAKENTPLHLASKKGNTDAIRALFEVGADDRVKNNAGQRANKMNDNANIKAMVENPGVHWPIKAYAVRNLSTAGADTSMRILCDDSKKCRVYLNCFDDGGNRFQGWIGDLEKQRTKTTTESIAKKATLSLSSSELKSLVGASDDTGALDCALHSPRRVTVRVWSIASSGKDNMTAYRLSEDDTTHQEATVRFYYGDTSTPYVHFRCFADENQDCRDMEFRCVDDTATSRTTIEAGTVKRLHKHIVAVSDSAATETDTGTSTSASASTSTGTDTGTGTGTDTGADLPSSGNAKGWYSCQVSSSNPFMVYVTDDIRKGDSIFTMNSTAISME